MMEYTTFQDSSGSAYTGFVPSFDFQLFQLPNFGELYANEFGAASRFNANYPTPYVNNSLATLLALAQPQVYPTGLFGFQGPSGRDIPINQNPREYERVISEYQRRTEEAIRKALEQEKRENESISLRGIFGLPPARGDVLCNDCTANQEEELKRTGTVKSDSEKLFQSPFGLKITKETGYLFIGVIILILLLLFVRR